MFRQSLFNLIWFLCSVCVFSSTTQAQSVFGGPQVGSIASCVGDATYSRNISTFRFSGEFLSTNMVLTPSGNFQVSIDGVNFGNSLSVPQTGGKVSGIAYVRTTATPAMGSLTGSLRIASGASGVDVTIKTIVSPLPSVNSVANQTFTAGTTTTPINFSGSANGYNWVNNTPAIGLPASGGGSIQSFTALNSGNSPVTATVTATPVNAGYIYIANQTTNNVSVVNSVGNNVTNNISVGLGPIKTIVSADGSRVYVLNQQGNSVSVIDALNKTVISTISLGVQPFDMELGKDGYNLYITSQTTNSVKVINLLTNTVSSSIAVGGGPREMYISPDGGHIYVSNLSPNSLSIINTANNMVEATIPGMGNAYRFLTSPDGTRLYVTDLSANTVSVINTVSNTLVATIPVGWYPSGLAISPDGSRLYSGSTNMSTISVINTATNSVVTTIPVAGACIGLSISADGNNLYYVDVIAQRVYIVSTASNTVTDVISVPGNLAYPTLSQGGGYIYILGLSDGIMNVISTSAKSVVARVNVGAFPTLYDESIGIGTGCSGTPVTFSITINPIPPPSVSVTGGFSSVSTSFGMASSSSNVNVSSSVGPFTVTPPPGFEVSSNNINFAPTVTIGSAGGFTGTPVYIRLAAISNAGSYSGNVVLSNPQISTTALMPNSTINPASITITASNVTKQYGDILIDYTGASGFTLSAGTLKNSNTITSANITYSAAKSAQSAVGVFTNAIAIGGITGANGFIAANYSINYIAGSVEVLPADLIITARNASKIYGTVVTTDPGFITNGLKNGETVSSVIYNYTAGNLKTDNVGVYIDKIVPSNAAGASLAAANYNIIYKPGTLTITPAIVKVKVNSTTKNFKQANPAFTLTYDGFLNGDGEAKLTQLPLLTSTATLYSLPGDYPIKASAAAALNYSFDYFDGVLTITPAMALAVPSVFTPNGDGVNDTWIMPELALYPNCKVEVFNRNGENVYRSIGYSIPWDGTIKGANLPAGVYYYIIDTKSAELRKVGNVTIVR